MAKKKAASMEEMQKQVIAFRDARDRKPFFNAKDVAFSLARLMVREFV